MNVEKQQRFDLTIGRLDNVLSELIIFSRDANETEANKQTLKHHAEDMVAAGQSILHRLIGVEGLPQPENISVVSSIQSVG